MTEQVAPAGGQRPTPTAPPLSGGIPHWFHDIGVPEPTDRLDGDAQCDVAIVGAG